MKVEVTEEHIHEGSRGNPSWCPVALGVYSGHEANAVVFPHTIEVYICGSITTFQNDEHLHNWIVDFDEGNETRPITITLDEETQLASIEEMEALCTSPST